MLRNILAKSATAISAKFQTNYIRTMSSSSPPFKAAKGGSKDSNMVWIDCEMSGLNPKVDTLLEIAVIVTDKDLNILAEGPNLVISQPDEVRSFFFLKTKGIYF